MTAAADPTGTIEIALAHAARLLQSDPVMALEQVGEILKAAPNHPLATLYLGIAQRSTGALDQSIKTLTWLTDAQHRWAAAQYELGLSWGEAGKVDAAVGALRRAVELKADLPDAWRALGDVLTANGDRAGADLAYANHIKASTRDPRLLAAASALVDNQIPEAETLLRTHLMQYPTDVAAIRMLAEVAARLGRNTDAENLLSRCLELAPGFDAARHNYAIVLQRQNKPAAALRQLDPLLAAEPHNPVYRNLQAVILAKIGDYHEAIEIYAEVLAVHPQQAKIWMSYGHALGTAGRQEESVAAYRRCIALAPNLGEAYWSLANLKTFRFTGDEIHAMHEQIERGDLSDEDRFHFHFALGKALEDSGSYADSFENYSKGNRLRRAGIVYSARDTSDFVRRSKALLTQEFFDSRAGFGAPAPDPIFIVGLPRSGSTLIEQILSSHSMVEGTMELPNILAMARQLSAKKSRTDESQYPGALAGLSTEECRALGEQYLEETRIQRKTSRPFFIDKMPNNFLHLGLIRLALPKAKIIDARRHPLACCFSGFKQHFAKGQNYSYRLEEIGQYYLDYVDYMAHFNRVLPGVVYRVTYEVLIEETESEVRRLLEYCQLPFEGACLRFYENSRAVRTASAQQVRKPIFRQGIDQWRHFEPWLEPLRRVLGEAISAYPGGPEV